MKTIALLSKVQFGLYVECVAHQGEACYNLPYLYVLDGSLEQVEDIEVEKPRLIEPFNIYGDRLFHIRLLKDAEHYYFFLDIHHIIGDGTTLKVMLADVDKVYGGGSLEPEQMTMAVASVCLTLLLFSANNVILSTAGRNGIFIFAVCMNLLQVYNLFLAGTCRTLQSLGAIQVGKGDDEGFISVSMAITCVLVWIFPQFVAELFGASTPEILKESNHALRVFALSFVPFCYIYAVMVVYKLYNCHRMAMFISFALSLTVIPVLWIIAKVAPDYLWYSYLIAYLIEILAIVALHRIGRLNARLWPFSCGFLIIFVTLQPLNV